MFKKSAYRTELWTVGIVHCPLANLAATGAIKDWPITWLPEMGDFRFIADPFGIPHDGQHSILVEALDYRTKRGEIHYYTYDAAWRLMASGLALRAPFHLSYPQILRCGQDIYLLPEAHKSGKLTLYRAERFPDHWQPVMDLLPLPAIDASVVEYQRRFWMFYALPGPNGRAMRELHLAYADQITGPWRQHARNPVRIALDSARPGGTPFIKEGILYLPTQDCVASYGAAINLLRIDSLTPTDFSAEIATRFSPAGLHPNYPDGLHSLSACGAVTLIDVKRIDPTPARRWINLQRQLRRLVGAG